MNRGDLVTFCSWWLIGAGCICYLLAFLGFKAKYGRYSKGKDRFAVPAKFAWIVQEIFSLVLPFWYGFQAETEVGMVAGFLVGLHYVNRCLLFPLYGKFSQDQPLFYFICAFILCTMSGYAQGAGHVDRFTTASLTDASSILGLTVFFAGAAINIHSDYLLRNLRKPGETEHKIPKGGIFEYVSGANFFGEILEWFGYFLFTRTLAGFSLFFFSSSNLGPRAFHHHKYYLQKFKNYPKNRKALIPYLI